jgi:hypothetical protein
MKDLFIPIGNGMSVLGAHGGFPLADLPFLVNLFGSR